MKYCPECLREVAPSIYGGFGCEPCGVLQYSNGILLDEPNEDSQRVYLLENKILSGLNIGQEKIDELVISIEKLYKLKR